MSQAVKISDIEMEAVRAAAAINSRSIAGQAEHWIRLGRAVERNPEFGFEKVERALRGLASVDSLSSSKRDSYFDHFADRMRAPQPAEHAFWTNRQKEGLGVGMDAAGALVHASGKRNARPAPR